MIYLWIYLFFSSQLWQTFNFKIESLVEASGLFSIIGFWGHFLFILSCNSHQHAENRTIRLTHNETIYYSPSAEYDSNVQHNINNIF